MKFRVTGGEDGQAGISVGSRRYEAGDIIEMTQAKAGWLIDRGLLVADSKAADPEPDPEPEPDFDDDELDTDDDIDDDIVEESED